MGCTVWESSLITERSSVRVPRCAIHTSSDFAIYASCSHWGSYRCACGVLEAALVFEIIVVFDIGVYFYIDKSIGSLAFVGGRRKYVYEIVSFHAFTVAIRFEFFSCTNY